MAMPAPRPSDGRTPRDCADHGPDVGAVALVFADRDAAAAESLIETLVMQAIRQWRLDDATFWQRVKFQARLIRATGGHGLAAGRS